MQGNCEKQLSKAIIIMYNCKDKSSCADFTRYATNAFRRYFFALQCFIDTNLDIGDSGRLISGGGDLLPNL